MNGGVKALMVGACVSAAACVTDTGKLEVRAIPDPATKLRAGTGDLAQAKALLALGSIGLALEGFRKTLREQPSNAEAMAGVAACYTAMGRYDLAQSNYEAALALAPQDSRLLMALAASLDVQGKTVEAAKARTDAARAASSPASTPSARAPRIETVHSAPAAELAQGPVQIARPTVALTSSITVKLPPARPVKAPKAPPVNAEVMGQMSLGPRPAPVTEQRGPAKSAATAQLAQAPAPHLERLSAGEVALVTTGRSMWQAQLVSRTRLSTTVRWIPIQPGGARPTIQVLNAARYAGIAAHARNVLLDRGWRRITIGDAPQVREKSIVYYPASRGALGRSLAAQFGIRALFAREAGGIVVLLGRDTAGLKAAQRRA